MPNQPISTYIDTLAQLLHHTAVTDKNGNPLALETGTSQAGGLIRAVQNAGGKTLVMGNGGSAAIASHLHNDLCKAVGVRAMVLTETPLLTALSNDLGYEAAFEKQVGLWAEPGDLLIVISSSGGSSNLLRAVNAAPGCRVITFSGFAADNPLRQCGDLNFYVPAQQYGFVELVHQVLVHYLTDCLMGTVPALR